MDKGGRGGSLKIGRKEGGKGRRDRLRGGRRGGSRVEEERRRDRMRRGRK